MRRHVDAAEEDAMAVADGVVRDAVRATRLADVVIPLNADILGCSTVRPWTTSVCNPLSSLVAHVEDTVCAGRAVVGVGSLDWSVASPRPSCN